MAGVNHTGGNHHGSRLNSLEPPIHDEKLEQLQELHDEEEGDFGALAAAEKRRHRSISYFPDRDLQDVIVSDSRVGSLESLTHPSERLHPHPPRHHSRSPSLRRHSPVHRSPSPTRRLRYDQHQPYHEGPGFSDAVVEIQRHVHHPHSQYNHRHKRGPWSASTSPARSPSPVHRMEHGRHHYGTTSLEQRSRSPSPIAGRQPAHPHHHHHHHHHHHPHQHSYPVLVTRRGQGRRLPPTPNKPSTLQLKPGIINFPKLNASPTHGSHMTQHVASSAAVVGAHVVPPPTGGGTTAAAVVGAHVPSMSASVSGHCPLSFEQAVAMGRGGRLLPSPVPNGYKPQPSSGPTKQRTPRSRHSDSDEDDWC
ncbi:hypothetical protein PV326_002348 [Microctonus aethiopoides]|nr:hypothetical protein PV326_002348 [Microctonus aethiopoides]